MAKVKYKYIVREDGGRFDLVNETHGRVIASYPKRADAEAHRDSLVHVQKVTSGNYPGFPKLHPAEPKPQPKARPRKQVTN
jgi:hypothetical protein